MERLILDLSIAFFFLATLLILSRAKNQIREKSKTSFGFLSTGVCLLAFMSAYTVVLNQLVKNGLLPANIFAMAELGRLLLLVSGLVLVTSGITKWLPLFREKSGTSDAFLNKYSGMKKCLRLLSEDTPVDDFLRNCLEVISDNIQVSMGTVYAVSGERNTAQLVASIGDFRSLENIAPKFVLNHNWLGRLTDSELVLSSVSFSEIQPNASGSCFCLSVKASDKLNFLFLIWSCDKLGAESFDSDILSAIAEESRKKIRIGKLRLTSEFASKCEESAERLREKVLSVETVSERLAILKSELENSMPLEFVSIGLLNDDKISRRISIGSSGTVLNELGISIKSNNSFVYQVIQSNRPFVKSDISKCRTDEFLNFQSFKGIKSFLAVPLNCGTRAGLLTVASKSSGLYGTSDKTFLLAVRSAVEIILNQMIHEERLISVTEREKALTRLALELSSLKSIPEIFKCAASAIRKTLQCPIIRMSTVDESGRFMSSQYLTNDSKSQCRTNEHAHLILSMLHWHNTAFANGRTVIVDCTNGNQGMENIESMQVFAPGVKRAAIVPIQNSLRVIGLISLADDKVMSVSELTEANCSFVEAVAAMAALSIEMISNKKNALAEFSLSAKDEIIDSGHRRNVRGLLRSSLSGIIGSLEMVRNKVSNERAVRERFLDIIDKSARKMSEYLTE